MNVASLLHKIQRLVQVGPTTAYQILSARVRKRNFIRTYKHKALRGNAHTRWSDIADQYAQLRTLQKPLHLVRTVMHEDRNAVIACADDILQCTFFLFNRQIELPIEFSWHQDFFCQQADNSFDSRQWYADIVIPVGQTDQLIKDIRVPWELSRFSFAWQLVYAFQHTKDEKYAAHLIRLMQDWIEQNPYLLGINWVCPMEVALRALNWIIALDLLGNSKSLTDKGWQQIVCSLYDHMSYLEHNWEWYDGKTSNHYLSNLVGYLALTSFFGQNQKSKKAFKQLCAEFDKQVFDEGTDYEGSTAYHRLVTELFLYGFVLSLDMNLPVLAAHMQKLQRMVEFVDWCTPVGGILITIGDDDSSVAVTGLSDAVRKQAQLLFDQKSIIGVSKTFYNFGLSIIKTQDWHVSLRHHAYQQQQPSGHFHSDVGSITLAYQGHPIFVDPGSYVYSASAMWRNHFRGVQAHNTFFIQGQEPIALNNNLFSLVIPEQECVSTDDTLSTYHDLYREYGLRAYRQIELNQQENWLIITDWWESQNSASRSNLISIWYFKLASGIQIEQLNDMQILIEGPDFALRCTAENQLIINNDYVATGYGYKQSCYVISLQQPLAVNKKYQFIIEKSY